MLRILLLFIVFFNLSIGFFVFLRNTKSLSSRAFSLLSIVTSIWTFINYMTAVSASLFWLRSSYALGSFVISGGLICVLIIFKKNIEYGKILAIAAVSTCFAVCSYLPGFIAASYNPLYFGAIFTGAAGWGLPLYSVFYATMGVLIMITLYKCEKRTSCDEEKYQLKYIFTGALITLVVSAFTSLILPSFSIFLVGGIDDIGFLFFLSLVAYSIIRHHLFHIQVIMMEIVTFGLWAFMLIHIFTAETFHQVLVESGLLMIMIIVGTILIQSVAQGIRQRNEIKDLTVNIESTYTTFDAVEKQGKTD